MNTGSSRDPLVGLVCLVSLPASPALASVTARDLATAWRLPGGLLTMVSPLVLVLVVGVGVVASLVVFGVCRARRVRRLLAARERWLLLPADTFDPSVEAVVRFAGQLGRVQRRGFGWLERPASAVRLRLDSAEGGRVVYGLEAPDRARPVVEAAVGEYPGVDLRAPEREEGVDG